MTGDSLLEVLTEAIGAAQFDEHLYNRAFCALGEAKETNKLLTAIADTLEEYWNYHNSRSLFTKSPVPIAPQAEDEREDLKMYVGALRKGITDFKSTRDPRSKVYTKCKT